MLKIKAHALPAGTMAVSVLLVGVAALLLLLGGCKGRAKEERSLNVVGSTSIQPFAELLAQEYMKKYPDRQVEVQGGGSTAGLQATSEGLADIGMCSRSLSTEEAKTFTPIHIARDGLAIVVNNANPVNGLTMEQLRGLFSGTITNWKDVGGVDGPVWPITREEGSGTRESFMKLVMAEEHISRRALTQESNGAVKELVKGDPDAIGYMSLGLVGNELKPLPIDGVAPTHDNVLNGSYTLIRPFLFVTVGSPGPAALEFISYVLSPEGQGILEREGLVSAL